ncbi:aminotransferase class I/II-fold pyridoxal phosphate-dependent enzyme [Fusobacterium sp.]|uniref:aminotransferase class I/II-fold pyridoxal phosphate-dependent enzyme n=1 Tax=Fusobacterium sp. TaxID=68766 RepID=UPI00396D0227
MKIKEIKKELNNLKKINNFRKLKVPDDLINLSSNDYLGLAHNKNLKDEFYKNFTPDLSASSSRLITGSSKEVMEFEKQAELIYKKPCITFNSGFDANSSIIETFCNKNTLILTDRLNHASIYDGIINSKAKFLRYRHLDMNNLEELLDKYSDQYEDILVITETVYSMDGDIANIERMTKMKKRYNFQLMVDEAHSYGVFGYGIIYNLNLIELVDFLVIPLGKGGASVGAMVICNEVFKDYIINKSRKFIFSTALPPVNHQWNLFILKNMNNFDRERAKLEILKNYTLKLLKENNIKTDSNTHIISIIVGSNEKVDIISSNMKIKGFLIYGVKEPTVPHGTARFRLSLNPDISKNEIERFVKELKNEIDTLL